MSPLPELDVKGLEKCSQRTYRKGDETRESVAAHYYDESPDRRCIAANLFFFCILLYLCVGTQSTKWISILYLYINHKLCKCHKMGGNVEMCICILVIPDDPP